MSQPHSQHTSASKKPRTCARTASIDPYTASLRELRAYTQAEGIVPEDDKEEQEMRVLVAQRERRKERELGMKDGADVLEGVHAALSVDAARSLMAELTDVKETEKLWKDVLFRIERFGLKVIVRRHLENNCTGIVDTKQGVCRVCSTVTPGKPAFRIPFTVVDLRNAAAKLDVSGAKEIAEAIFGKLTAGEVEVLQNGEIDNYLEGWTELSLRAGCVIGFDRERGREAFMYPYKFNKLPLSFLKPT